MSLPPSVYVSGAIELAKLALEFAEQAPNMTPEQRAARWQEVVANASNAGELWERSKAIREGAGR